MALAGRHARRFLGLASCGIRVPSFISIMVMGNGHATAHDGTVVYRNEGVLVDKLVWGRVKQHVSYEDTQKTDAFDEYLGVAQARPGSSGRSAVP